MSSDDEAPIVKRVVKRQVVDSDSDDDVVVRKPAGKAAAKKAVAADSDSDDDAPVVARAAKKPAAAAAADSDDDDDTPVVARARRVAVDDSDDEDEGAKGKHVDPTAGPSPAQNLVDLIAYDDMTTAQFLELLKSQTKRQRMAEKAAVAERKKDEAAEKAAGSGADEVERKFDGTPGMTYAHMLERIMVTCRQNNPNLARNERIQLMMPRVERSGAKKTALTNFKELCIALNRTQEEVKDFIDKYLTSTSSVDSNVCLIIKIVNGKTTQFERMLEKYVEQYVRCNSCGQIDTELHREASTRLQLLTCNGCKASRYTQAVGGATYQAQTTKRARMRAKML